MLKTFAAGTIVTDATARPSGKDNFIISFDISVQPARRNERPRTPLRAWFYTKKKEMADSIRAGVAIASEGILKARLTKNPDGNAMAINELHVTDYHIISKPASSPV